MRTLLLIVHLIAIATGTGMSISNSVNLGLAANETGEGRAALASLRRQLARMADAVIAIIWITGLGLWFLDHSAEQPNNWFLLKLVFVVTLTLSHGLARMTAGRIARTGDQALLPRLGLFVSGVWLSAMAAIAFAVVAFTGY
ncbi:MAG: hypothetical protein ACREDN_11395 [Aestuariivirga sp.]